MDINARPTRGTSNDVITGTEISSEKRGLDVFPYNTPGTPLYVVPASGASAPLQTQTVAVTVSAGQINTFVSVPVTGLNNVFQVDIYDATNTFEIFIEYRISLSNVLEIKSAVAQTYTIRIIGA